MAHEIRDLQIDRVSLVKRPANRRPFLLLKSEDGDGPDEIRKATIHHLSSLLDLFGRNPNLDETAQQVADMIDGGSGEAHQRVLQFLSSARAVHDGLRSVKGENPMNKAGESNVGSGVFLSWWRGRAIVVADADANPQEVADAVAMVTRWHYENDPAKYAAAVAEARQGLPVTDDVSVVPVKPAFSNTRGTPSQYPGSPASDVNPRTAGNTVVALSPELKKRAERDLADLYAAIEAGQGAVYAVLAKSDSSERATDVLAREISTMLAKQEQHSATFSEVYEAHRQLTGAGSEWTVNDLKQALRKGTNFVDEVEAMSKAEREKVLADPALMEEYRRSFHQRASRGGDVG